MKKETYFIIVRAPDGAITTERRTGYHYGPGGYTRLTVRPASRGGKYDIFAERRADGWCATDAATGYCIVYGLKTLDSLLDEIEHGATAERVGASGGWNAIRARFPDAVKMIADARAAEIANA